MSPPPIHLSTILSLTPLGLLEQITRLSAKYGKRGRTVLFALSANFPRSEDLQSVVEQLTSFNGIPENMKGKGNTSGHTLGCLTDSFAGVSFQKPDLTGTRRHNPGGVHALSCSIGIFDSKHCVPFRSELAGRTQPQVGRWHAFRKKSDDVGSDNDVAKGAESGRMDWERMKDSADGEVNWENIWNSSSPSTNFASLLPESLQKIEPSQIQTLVMLSSSHPDTLTRVLTDYISTNAQATALTLVAAPTHFITGRGVTLFMDGQIYGEGAVGLAFLRDSAPVETRSTFQTEFVGVKKLSGPMTVTSREGNMINSLNDSNPTRLLLSALDLAGIDAAKQASSSPFAATFKDDEQFALGLLAPDGQILETYKITAGDPSSRGGSLSLDAPRAPEVGSAVQFLHCPANTRLVLPSTLLRSTTASDVLPSQKTLAFLTVPELVANNEAAPSEDIDTDCIFEDAFIAPSTQGFIVSRPTTPSLRAPDDMNQPMEVKSMPAEPWSCSLPGGIALLKW